MYRYRSGIRTVILHEVGRWGNPPEFCVEADAGDSAVRIELDRREALKLRRDLAQYIKATAPARKR